MRLLQLNTLRMKCTGRNFNLLKRYFAANFKVDKQLLAKLRKESGSPFSKCHSALAECNNDFEKALSWLEEQSKKEGWKKAEKMKGRQASEGLVSAVVEDNIAALVEVNCETDFVARNDAFKDLTMRIAKGALEYKKRIIRQNSKVNSFAGEDIAHLREIIPPHDLEDATVDNEVLKDSIVSTVSQLGENIILKRAVAIATSRANSIGACSHGNISGHAGSIHFGKYAALVVLENREGKDLQAVCTGLAQHVIGMKPVHIDKEADHPEAELALMNQEYLLDSSITVRGLVEKYDTDVIDFVRFQCGE